MDMYKYIAEEYGAFIGTEQEMDYTFDSLINEPNKMKELLEFQSKQMNDCKLTVAGTLFGKRYSVLSMALMDIWNQYNVLLNFDFQNGGIKCTENGCMQYIFPSVLKISDSTKCPSILNEYVFEHLNPLFESVANVSRCKKSHLFSLVSHNLHQTTLWASMENRSKEQEFSTKLSKFLDQGMDQENPLNFTFELNQKNPENPFYIRKHCCLSYKIKENDQTRCCGTCPLIN